MANKRAPFIKKQQILPSNRPLPKKTSFEQYADFFDLPKPHGKSKLRLDEVVANLSPKERCQTPRYFVI